jgi:hypothetical protein
MRRQAAQVDEVEHQVGGTVCGRLCRHESSVALLRVQGRLAARKACDSLRGRAGLCGSPTSPVSMATRRRPRDPDASGRRAPARHMCDPSAEFGQNAPMPKSDNLQCNKAAPSVPRLPIFRIRGECLPNDKSRRLANLENVCLSC